MGFSLKDIQKWIEGIADTVGGGRPGQVGNRNVQDALVNPGRVLSDFSGVTQGVKGASPGSSNVDKGLAMLGLVGMLGGQEAAMGVKALMTPEYAYGLHVSPVSGLSKIKPGSKVGVTNGGNFGDAEKGMAYFFKSGNDKDLTELQNAVNVYLGRLQGGVKGGATAYSVKTPLKKVSMDENMGHFASKTPKNLKVINSSKLDRVDVMQDFLSRAEPKLPDNMEESLELLISLIKDNPKYSNVPSSFIGKGFQDKMNKKLEKELYEYRQFKNKPKPNKVVVTGKRKKATP